MTAKFTKFGSLYYKFDVEAACGDQDSELLIGGHENLQKTSKFTVGPSTDRNCLEDERASVNFDRGPCMYRNRNSCALLDFSAD